MDNEAMLLQLIKDVAKLQEGFDSFKKERKDDNSGMQNDVKEIKSDIKSIQNKMVNMATKEELSILDKRVTTLEKEPGTRARKRQDKVVEYILIGVLSVIGSVLVAILFTILRQGVNL